MQMPSLVSWAPTTLSADVVALSVEADVAYVGLADGRVLHTSGSGGPWHVAVEGGMPISVLHASSGRLSLAGPEGLRHIASDGEVVWATGFPERGNVVALARSGGITVAGTRSHGVFRSDDGGVTWTDSNRGLPYRGLGLSIFGLATAGACMLVAHSLGISRSRDGGRAWEEAGAGLPLRFGRLSIAVGGQRVFAETGGRLFQLEGETWTERGRSSITLLGADAGALYGLDAAKGMVWCDPDRGRWVTYGHGLPEEPLLFASGTTWQWVALVSGALWRRPLTAPPSLPPVPQLGAVPPFLTGLPAEIAFTLPAPSDVALALIDTAGTEVVRLVEGPCETGRHHVQVAVDGLAAGLYQCRLTAGDYSVSRSLAVMLG